MELGEQRSEENREEDIRIEKRGKEWRKDGKTME